MKSPYQQQIADLSAQVPSVTVTMTYYEASIVRDALQRAARQLQTKLDTKLTSPLLRTVVAEQVRVIEFAAARVQRNIDTTLDTHRTKP